MGYTLSSVENMACSICNAPNSFTGNCEIKSPGGNARKVYFAHACEIASYTLDAYNGKVESITMEAGEVFRTMIANRLSINTTQEHQEGNGSTLQTVTLALPNLSDNADLDDAAQEAINFITDLRNSENPFVMLIEDNAGVMRVFGYVKATGSSQGLEVATSVSDSGTALADSAITSITLTHGAPALAPVLDSTFTIPI